MFNRKNRKETSLDAFLVKGLISDVAWNVLRLIACHKPTALSLSKNWVEFEEMTESDLSIS